MAEKTNITQDNIRPNVALSREDIGNLDSVLRDYYLSQIKSLAKRKDRKLARRLLQDHLVLPKSRQRTSKDAAYIKEILGIEFGLLNQLEESRLIRRIQKLGTNPIYEVSHDTLIEPILSERSNRLAIRGFIKKAWKYLAALLLLWFLLGMIFENKFAVLPEPLRKNKSIEVLMDKQVIAMSENPSAFTLTLPPLLLEQDLNAKDSILIQLPLEPVNVSRLRRLQGTNSTDTISIVFASPIDVPIAGDEQTSRYQAFSNVLVPLAFSYSNAEADGGQAIYAKVSGSIRMSSNAELSGEGGPNEYNQIPQRPIILELGDTFVQASTNAKSIPVNFTLQLSDLFDSEVDKNNIRTVIGDRSVQLNYLVRVSAAPATPPPPQVELPAVQGIEVQYSDGSKRFIPNNTPTGTETIHVVVAGETLFSIAKQYNLRDATGNISTKALMEVNGLQNSALSVGQRLRVPD